MKQSRCCAFLPMTEVFSDQFWLVLMCKSRNLEAVYSLHLGAFYPQRLQRGAFFLESRISSLVLSVLRTRMFSFPKANVTVSSCL